MKSDRTKNETLKYSLDHVQKCLAKINEAFPDSLTERYNKHGEVEIEVNIDKLCQKVSTTKSSASHESFQLVWPGKTEALNLADAQTTDALVPCEKQSINYDSTKNMLIEGDNLDALKLLTQSHSGKIRCIYIDPPYNRKNGCELIYKDSFKSSKDRYSATKNHIDDQTSINKTQSSLLHSEWMSMIYPRLKVARELLADDGVMFISIDDSEYSNLKKICDELYGEKNVETMIWEKVGDGDAGAGRMKNVERFRIDHEYVLAVYKNIKPGFKKRLAIPKFVNTYGNPDNDPRGPYKGGNMSKTESKSLPEGKNYYTVYSPSGRKFSRQWHFSKEEFERLDSEGRIYWGKNKSAVPAIKIFLNEPRAIVNSSIIKNAGSATSAAKEQKKIFGQAGIFDNPKPVELIKYLIKMSTNKNDTVMDFFAGSATTAQAVIEANYEDSGQRNFIMIQLPENCSIKSKAFKEGFKNIFEIALKRITLIAQQFESLQDKKQTNQIDCGFKMYKLAPVTINSLKS